LYIGQIFREFLGVARVWVEWDKGDYKYNKPVRQKIGRSPKASGQKGRGSGGRNFCPPAVPRSGTEGFILIGQKYQEITKEKNLSQDKLSKLANIAHNTIIKIESGLIKNPKIGTVQKLRTPWAFRWTN
jgi:DNA-binding XRE family transcriptional regulator